MESGGMDGCPSQQNTTFKLLDYYQNRWLMFLTSGWRGLQISVLTTTYDNQTNNSFPSDNQLPANVQITSIYSINTPIFNRDD